MIIGLTDKPKLRRDGKIRCGKKEGNKLVNLDHFLLHDAPGLAASLGEEFPKEIYFTVYTNNTEEIFRPSLRWYNANELLCHSMHNALDNNGISLGAVANYTSLGDIEGVSQIPFPRMNRGRIRACKYHACPQYMQGQCSEHMFLDIMIPQHSMGSVFTFDSTSIKALQNTMSAFEKAAIKYGGSFKGQIFKAFKADDTGSFVNKNNGKTTKTDIKVLQFEVVDFGWYEANFKNKIKEDDWNALLALRSKSSIGLGALALAAPADDDAPALNAPAAALQAPSGTTTQTQPATNFTDSKANEDAVKTRANDPTAAQFFTELAKLMNRANTEEVRIATARNFSTAGAMISYLQNKIKEEKKKQSAAAGEKTQPAQQQDKQQTQQQQTKQPDGQQQGKQQATSPGKQQAQTTQSSPANQQQVPQQQADGATERKPLW